MQSELTQIQRLLNDPSISSSALPLLIVFSILISGTLFALYRLFIMFRTPTGMAHEKAPKQKGSIREWVRHIFVVLPTQAKPVVSKDNELDRLRELVRKLEQANKLEREAHARALTKITELQGELKRLNDQHRDDGRLLDLERQRSLRLEDRIHSLELKLQDAIRETERIFQQNAAVATPTTQEAKATPVSEILKDFPPPPKEDK